MAISRNMMERQLRAGGGIMTLEEPRQGYFLGKIVRKAKKAVKKVVKSPLGKIALGAAAANFAPLLFGKGTLLSQAGGLPGLRTGLGSLVSKFKGGEGMLGQLGNIFKVGGKSDNPFSLFRVGGGLLGASALAAPFLMGGDEEEIDEGVDVTGVQPMVSNIRQQAKDYYQDPTKSALYFMPPKSAVKFGGAFAEGGLADIPREGYRIGGGVMSMLGKAGDAVKNVTRNVVTKLSRMTDDVEIQTATDYAEDTGVSLDIFITPKSKKGKDTLDSLVEEGIMTVDESGTYMPKFGYEDDAVMGMEKLKASGLLQEGGKFRRFDEGAGIGDYDMPYGGYEQLVETFGRQKKADGGIMDLGGMEKDYRTGGFVEIGAKERADDVPARLSKNEFVFTADAVRNAGEGDIDKGAKVMQNMMDNLEAGGNISEESQGKENPAQAMFDQAQQLESRIA